MIEIVIKFQSNIIECNKDSITHTMLQAHTCNILHKQWLDIVGDKISFKSLLV